VSVDQEQNCREWYGTK